MRIKKHINNHKFIENKGYQYGNKKKFFNSKINKKKPYTIVMPPPNITGVLHMGHILNNTIQDILIRKARMKNYEACGIPGTDHASIATETVVIKKLKKRGINKKNISKKKFLRYIGKHKKKYKSIIVKQLKKIGISCDWKRIKFTMDNSLSKTVKKVFIELYKKKIFTKEKK